MKMNCLHGMKVLEMCKVLIIGCGSQGCFADAPNSGCESKIISFAKAFSEHPKTFDVYVTDLDIVAVELAIKTWGFQMHEFGIKYDIVVVTTPDNTHFDILKNIPFTTPGTKLVVCEKPMCMTSIECEKIIKLYEEYKIPILVNYTRRFIPYLIALKKNGLAINGFVEFNRGWEHTGTHAIDFFNMFDCKNVEYKFINKNDERIWNLMIQFQNGYVFKEYRGEDDPVPHYYDFHTRYVIKNILGFLENKEPLLCTMYDAIKSIKIMEEQKDAIRQKRNGRSKKSSSKG